MPKKCSPEVCNQAVRIDRVCCTVALTIRVPRRRALGSVAPSRESVYSENKGNLTCGRPYELGLAAKGGHSALGGSLGALKVPCGRPIRSDSGRKWAPAMAGKCRPLVVPF